MSFLFNAKTWGRRGAAFLLSFSLVSNPSDIAAFAAPEAPRSGSPVVIFSSEALVLPLLPAWLRNVLSPKDGVSQARKEANASGQDRGHSAPSDSLPISIAVVFPLGGHPILQSVKAIEPISVLQEGRVVPENERVIADYYLSHLIHGHALAAFDAWRFSSVGHKVGKFGDKVATDALTRWYNMMPFVLRTQAAEGARDEAATVGGDYGLPRVLGIPQSPDVAYASDPVEVTERLQRHNYLANTSIAAYALGKLYALHGASLPVLRIPDKVYFMGVVGPKGSGVRVDLPRAEWVAENMRRAAAARRRSPESLRVTGMLLRERHFELINDTLRVLKMQRSDIPGNVRGFFQAGSNETAFIPASQVTAFKNYVKKSTGGKIVLHNTHGGALTMMTDGDVMPLFEMGLGKADMAFGAGGVSEAMIKTRGEYANIDFSGMIISNAATKDGKADSVQVLDPAARVLTAEESELAEQAGISVQGGRVEKIFGLDDLTGGPDNLTLISSPLGNNETHESDFVPGLREVEILDHGRAVRVTLLAVMPSGRKMLIPIVYDTGLQGLITEFKNAEHASERMLLLFKIGRVYGNLKMYAEADRMLAMAAASESIDQDPSGLRAYYKGMEELLTKGKPDVELAKSYFEASRRSRNVLALMMLDVIAHGEPRPVEVAEVVDVVDNLAKASPEGRDRAADILVNRIATATTEHLSAIKLLANKLQAFRWFAPVLSDRVEFLIARIEQAISENPEINGYLDNGKLRSPASGYWGYAALPGTFVEEIGTWLLAKVFGYHPYRPVIRPEESYVEVPEVLAKPRDLRTLLLAISFPVIWSLAAILTGIGEWHLLTTQAVHTIAILAIPHIIAYTARAFAEAKTPLGSANPSYKPALFGLTLLAAPFGFLYQQNLDELLPNWHDFGITLLFMQSVVLAVLHWAGWGDRGSDVHRVLYALGLSHEAPVDDKLRSPAGSVEAQDKPTVPPTEKDLLQQVEKATPEYVKRDTTLDLSSSDAFTYRMPKEFLLPYDADKNPLGHGIYDWFGGKSWRPGVEQENPSFRVGGYKGEAKVSTAGIRGRQNVLYTQDTRVPLNQWGMMLATEAKARVAVRKYHGRAVHKLAVGEVRYNTSRYLEIISRIQAAHGVKEHVEEQNRSLPIWLTSFLTFVWDLAGAEYVTSSHADSQKIATKDIQNQGSQYLPEESMEFIAEMELMYQEMEKNGYYDFHFSATHDASIDRELLKNAGNGIGLYAGYLKKGIATDRNLNFIRGAKKKIYIDVQGGSMYRTLEGLFKKLEIFGAFKWLHTQENSFFHGIGKEWKFSSKTNKWEYNDLSADTSITIVDKKSGRIRLPVLETMGYGEKLADAAAGTTVFITDPDGDRLVTLQVENASRRDLLDKIGIATMDLSDDRIIAAYTPNQSFLMTMDYQAQALKRAGLWDNHPRFIIKTTASAASWDEWATANGVAVVNVPVGFKEIAAIMKKVEKQLEDHPDREVIITDVTGKTINLGVQPRLVFAGEESGGEIFGPEDLIVSVHGRKAIAMREKSAGEALVISSAMAAEIESQGRMLSDYLLEIFDNPSHAPNQAQPHSIVRRFDYRHDQVYYNESEPDPAKLLASKAEGELLRTANDVFYLSIALAIRMGRLSFEQGRKILADAFKEKGLDFSNLLSIDFVGDGTYMNFADKYVEVRPSGTDAKTKGYAAGNDKDVAVKYAIAMAEYSGERTLLHRELIPHDIYDRAKDIQIELYTEFAREGAPAEIYQPPVDDSYLNDPRTWRSGDDGSPLTGVLLAFLAIGIGAGAYALVKAALPSNPVVGIMPAHLPLAAILLPAFSAPSPLLMIGISFLALSKAVKRFTQNRSKKNTRLLAVSV